MIRVIKPGMLTTVQDLGRFGYAHLGLSPAGAADSLSLRIANLVTGNDADTPALEMTLLGPTLEFELAATIAISGSRTSLSVPVNEPVEVAAGTQLALGPLLDGARAYLAVRGGIAVPEVMHSCSTFIPATMGGFQGRSLQTGDRLAVGERKSGVCRKRPQLNACLDLLSRDRIRVTPSLQFDWFDQETTGRFCEETFAVTDDSNRSGLRLMGSPLNPAKRGQLLTEGIALGAVQVPPDGQPIILFVDQQTTGGYAKIANVLAADLPKVGQLRPREKVRFQFVTIPEAVKLLREQEQALRLAFEL